MSDQMSDADDELLALMKQALDHAIDSIEGGETLIPFTMSVGADDRAQLQRFMLEDYAEGVRQAAGHVEDGRGNVRLAVIAFDTLVPFSEEDGGRQDALVVEGHHESLDGAAVRMAQAYVPGRPAKFLRKAKPPELRGTPRFIGNGRNLLMDPQDPAAHAAGDA